MNVYGDPFRWVHLDTTSKIMMEILNPNKYPPSLLYLLMTLGGAFLFLANTEHLKGKTISFFSTFGRVPFFYYILHLFFIHFAAMLFAQLSGFGWQSMILKSWITEAPALKGFGYRLWVVYAVWAGIILLLYPLCKKFDIYKSQHKEKCWLSYL